MSEFFGISAIELNEDQLWPAVQTLPMAWSHSLCVGQQLHHEILYRAGLPKDQIITAEKRCEEISDYRFGVYIDDYFSFDISKDISIKFLQTVVKAFVEASAPSKASNMVCSAEQMIRKQ